MSNRRKYLNMHTEARQELEKKIHELALCLVYQGFLEEYFDLPLFSKNNKIPVGFGLRNILLHKIAQGEACKIIQKEGIE